MNRFAAARGGPFARNRERQFFTLQQEGQRRKFVRQVRGEERIEGNQNFIATDREGNRELVTHHYGKES